MSTRTDGESPRLLNITDGWHTVTFSLKLRRRYFKAMLTTLNGVLSASSVALGIVVLLGTSVLAETVNKTLIVTGTVIPFASISVTPNGNTFPITYGVGTPTTGQIIGKVAYVTNVLGIWDIKAQGGNLGKEGQLVSTGLTATIPYQVSLSSTTNFVTPVAASNLAAATALFGGEIAVDDPVLPTNTTGTNLNLRIKILAANTKVPTATGIGSPYRETLTLVLTSGQ